MKIIIAGAGDIGAYLATVLSNENQDVKVLDRDAESLQNIDSNCNVMTHCGDPTSLATLKNADAASCHLFVAVLPDDAENILACTLAKSLGASRTVAKVTKYHFLDEDTQAFLRNAGVDFLANNEYLAAKEALSFLHHPWAKSRLELLGGELTVVGVKITEEAPICGMHLKGFSKRNQNFHVAAIVRTNETIIPCGDDKIEPQDILYFSIAGLDQDHLISLTGKSDDAKVSRVNVMGGSEIAMRLVALDRKSSVKYKVMERDAHKCSELADAGLNCEIINGDARKLDVLAYAGLSDVFMAMSKSDEVNIMTCVAAKGYGFPCTVAVVEDVQNIPLAESFAIDKVINRKLVAANYLYRILMSGDASMPKSIGLADAEILEICVAEGAPVTKSAVHKLKLPKHITLAGMIRDGRGALIEGSTQLLPGDRVVVVCKTGSVLSTKKLFLNT